MKQDSNETRIALLEQTTGNINKTLERIEKRLEEMDKKMDTKFEVVNNRIWFNFYWGVAGIASVLGVLAHALKWI